MSLILQATSGPAAGTKIVVTRGLVLRVGRTKWADRSIAGDATLADVHFAIDFRSQHGLVKDLSGDRGTLLNGETIVEAEIHTGDRIQAGQTTFSVLVQGEPPPAPDPAAQAADETDVPMAKETARDYARHVTLGAEAKARTAGPPVAGRVSRFVDRPRPFRRRPDFLGVLAAQADRRSLGLPMPGIGRRRSPAAEAERRFRAARQWFAEPNEKNRRKAEAAAENANYEGPASFLAAAAFWSGGSIAPEGLAEVPPEKTLTAQAVSAALLMAGTWGPPTQTADRYRGFLQEGKKLAASQPES